MPTGKTRRAPRRRWRNPRLCVTERYGERKGERERDGPWTRRGRERRWFRLALVGHHGYGYVIDGRRDAVDRSFSPTKKGSCAPIGRPWARRCPKDSVMVELRRDTSIPNPVGMITVPVGAFEILSWDIFYTSTLLYHIILRIVGDWWIKTKSFIMYVCFHVIMHIKFSLKNIRLWCDLRFFMT